MGAVEDLKYYRDKGGMGLSSLTIEQRAIIELDERVDILFSFISDLNEAIQVIQDRLHSKTSADQGVHGGHLDDHPSGDTIDNK